MADDDTTEAPEVEYTKPTSQLDMEARSSENYVPPTFNEQSPPTDGPYAPTDEGFVGVAPEYQNFANDTDEPLAADEGVNKEAEEAFADSYETGEKNDALQAKYDEVTPHAGNTSSDTEPAPADPDEEEQTPSDPDQQAPSFGTS